MLATELGLAPSDNLKIIELKDLITKSDGYDEEFVKDVLNVIVEERTTTEKQKVMELEDKQKAVAQQQEREFELEKLRIQLELQKLPQAPVTFKKKEEFRKPFSIKKSQPGGGYHDNHSPGPSRTGLDYQVLELKEESPYSVTDVGLLESSNKSALPAREQMKWETEGNTV
ncbi:hypothetical protein TNCT_39491 [Trichonephila clavata]|uniref:Uncharacterized protein n=1 Tax=Trichonephila clavata TaxID=2740835 RepID=A0A8X6GPV8_TRICU|nr:hypothetical protein TNCT_39491 [Trichonephila clavata]